MIHLPSKTAMLSLYMFTSMPYTIVRAICMHDYDMLPPSHGGSSGLQRFFRCAMFIYSFYLCYSLSLYPFTERYAQPYFFSCLIRQLERFNKQKPRSFEKATAPVDAENWIYHMEKIFNVMGCEDAFKTRFAVYKFEGIALAWLITVTWAEFKKLFFLLFFPRAEQERLKREYHSIRQTNTETSTEFMQRFLRLAGFLGAAAGTEEEQAKNFQWSLRRSTLNHLMCMSYTDVARVANAARNYEILHERDDDDAERPDKRQKSGDRHQPTSQQSGHRNHGHNNDHHGSDRRGGGDNHRSNNNYSGNNNRNSGNGHDQRNKGQQSNRSANSGSQQSRGPFEGYSYPVCTTCGRRQVLRLARSSCSVSFDLLGSSVGSSQ
nr:hypothetical protein [Tanacetum cinerariifolium]